MVKDPKLYCLKCRKKQPMSNDNVRLYSDKKGGYHMSQSCPICSTKRNQIVSGRKLPDDVKNDPQLKSGGFFLEPIKSLLGSIL